MFQRKSDRRWVAQLSRGGRVDRQVVRSYASLRNNTRDAADALLAELEAEYAVSGRSTPVGMFLSRWVAEHPGLRPSTRRGYEAILRHHIGLIADIPIWRLTVADVERNIRAIPGSPATAHNVLAFLRAALKDAMAYRLVERNEAWFAKGPRSRKPTMVQLDPAQVGSFLVAIRDDRLYPLFLLAALTGMRSGELIGLRWQDVHPTHLVVASQMARVTPEEARVYGHDPAKLEFDRFGKAYALVPLKTDNSSRTLPLPSMVVEALAALKPADAVPGQLVFVSEHDMPINAPWLVHHFQALLAANGLPKCRLHSLRGTVSSIHAASGVTSPKTASLLLGHAQVGTTLDVYARGLTPELEAAAGRVQTAVFGPVSAGVSAEG